MKNLLIVGGGFAGFWGAMSAARRVRELEKNDELKITLVSRDEYHGIRPRFYEADLAGTRIPLKTYLSPLSIDLVVGEVSEIDTGKRLIFMANSPAPLVYDAMILAAGSRLKTPDIPGIERTFNVDTFEEASRLEEHFQRLSSAGFSTPASKNIVVVGGGFTGLEAATSLPQRMKSRTPNGTQFNFFLVDRAARLASNYSADAQKYILDQLDMSGIRLLLGEEVEQIESGKMVLKSGRLIDTDTVIWTTGLEASPLTEKLKGRRDGLGRLHVDSFLQLPDENALFAAGDVASVLADERNYALMSCQHALPQGKFAGHNAVNTLFGIKPIAYLQPRYATCLDLGPENALLTGGWERTFKMSGAEAKALKRQIVSRWIYPADNVEETLRMSAPEILR